jgi:hypothetical protein
LAQTRKQQLDLLIPFSVDGSQRLSVAVNLALETQPADNLIEHHGVRHAKTYAYEEENARFTHYATFQAVIASVSISWA